MRPEVKAALEVLAGIFGLMAGWWLVGWFMVRREAHKLAVDTAEALRPRSKCLWCEAKSGEYHKSGCRCERSQW